MVWLYGTIATFAQKLVLIRLTVSEKIQHVLRTLLMDTFTTAIDLLAQSVATDKNIKRYIKYALPFNRGEFERRHEYSFISVHVGCNEELCACLQQCGVGYECHVGVESFLITWK